MNDSAAQEPLYDLQSFKDSIPKDIAAIKYGAVETADIAKPVATTSVFKKPVLWAIVVAIVVGLLFFTTKLSKEVAKEQ